MICYYRYNEPLTIKKFQILKWRKASDLLTENSAVLWYKTFIGSVELNTLFRFKEKYFDMKKHQCKEALEIYKRFLIRMTKLSEFLKVAEVKCFWIHSMHGFWSGSSTQALFLITAPLGFRFNFYQRFPFILPVLLPALHALARCLSVYLSDNKNNDVLFKWGPTISVIWPKFAKKKSLAVQMRGTVVNVEEIKNE